jgi:uncharacterized protein (DUF305 family)
MNSNNDNICRGYLLDSDYLKHMIPHHQVAIDMSILLQKKTKNAKMQDVLRQLIWVQNYEINLMYKMLKKMPFENMSINEKGISNYMVTVADLTKPNEVGLSKTFCDPNFFDKKNHMKHMAHVNLTDEIYIKHMIPHHQVAVDMSKVLLKNTKSDFMIYFANRIIYSQQQEIVLLNDMLNNNNFIFDSELLH